jgi:hypothetical protein
VTIHAEDEMIIQDYVTFKRECIDPGGIEPGDRHDHPREQRFADLYPWREDDACPEPLSRSPVGGIARPGDRRRDRPAHSSTDRSSRKASP